MKLNKKPFVLALAIAAGIAAVATTKVRASADTQLLALMPPSSQILVGARFDQAAASPLGQLISAKVPLDELKNKTGFDPRTDLREVVISPIAKLIAARGTFPVSKIEAVISQSNHRIENYRGLPMLGDSHESVAFLDGSTVVIGSADAVHQAIDRWISHAQAPENDLMAKVAEVSATSQGWIAATNVSSLPSLLGPGESQETVIVRNVLNKLGTVVGHLTLPQTGGVSVEGQLQATSPEDAQTLMDAYQALKLLAPPDAANHPLFSRPQVNLNGSTIHFGLAITQQEVETMLH